MESNEDRCQITDMECKKDRCQIKMGRTRLPACVLGGCAPSIQAGSLVLFVRLCMLEVHARLKMQNSLFENQKW